MNFRQYLVFKEDPEFSSSVSNALGITQPIKKATRKPPPISKVLAMESKLSKKDILLTEGIPRANMIRNEYIEAYFLFKLNLSINVETGISNKETIDVIAAM